MVHLRPDELPARPLQEALGRKLAWARLAPGRTATWILLGFEGTGIVRLESDTDGVGLLCSRVVAVPPQLDPPASAFDACAGRTLIAVRPLLFEYESELDDVGPSCFVLEFDGGRRICITNVSGELVVDRTGRGDQRVG